jgi:hypothetical protein
MSHPIRVTPAALLLAALTTAAQAQSFTSEPEFIAAAGGHCAAARYTFDGIPHGTVMTTQMRGVNFGGTVRAWDALHNGGGGTFESSPNVLFNFGTAPMSFEFDTAVQGVGFYNTSLADREQATFFDAAGNTLFVGTLPEATVNFLGFVAAPFPPTSFIKRVSVVGIPPSNGTIFIDSLVFAAANPCRADFNGDGAVNVVDFLAFLAAYSAGDCLADLDGGGTVNVNDFLRFLAQYAVGCS